MADFTGCTEPRDWRLRQSLAGRCAPQGHGSSECDATCLRVGVADFLLVLGQVLTIRRGSPIGAIDSP